jgi:sulfide:quinone oxidoreductase
VLFNIDHLLRRHGVRERFSITAFAPMENPGVRMGAAAAASVHDFLGRAGIERRFGKSLSGFDAEGVRFNDGSRLDADLVVFIPGGTGHPVLKDAQLPLNPAGFVRTDDRGQVVGFPHIYAVGDVADLRGPDFRAKQGHVAELMAEVAAADILATSKGAPRPEGYEARVDLLCLMDTGNGAALIHRTRQRERFIVLPWVGHQLKKAWAYYYRFQRLPLGAFAAWLWRELGTEIASWLGGKPTPRHLPAPHLLKLRK